MILPPNPSSRRGALWRQLCTALLAVVLMLPGLAHAQGQAEDAAAPAKGDEKAKGDKKEVVVQKMDEKFQKARPSLKDEKGGGGKAFNAQDFIADKKTNSGKKRDEAIVRVKKLLDVTPANHPSRAEFLYNLAELYFDKAKYYDIEAYNKQDECYALKAKNEENKAKACNMVMNSMIEESKRLRMESNRLYGELIEKHADFKYIDEVYYYKGNNHQALEEKGQMITLYKDLINKFPRSKFIPNVLLAFGDYYFDADEMADAAKFYDKVTDTYPNSAVYAYASYKKGWCYFNTNDKEKALQQFLATFKFSQSRPDLPNSKPLMQRALNDIVTTYSFVGAATKALPFFKKMTKDDKERWTSMGERLAAFYSDKGKFDESSIVYRDLIKSHNTSVRVVDYQYEIARNSLSQNSYSEDALKQIVLVMKLMKLVQDGRFKDYDKEKFEPTLKRIEEFSRKWATIFHIEAQKTKKPEIYTRAYYLYKTYVDTFPNSETMYHMAFFFGELLFRLKKYEEAAAQYERVLAIDEKGKYSKDAIFGTVLSYFKYVEVSEKIENNLKKSIEQSDPDNKKATNKDVKEIPKPKELTGIQKRFLVACERYAKLAPDGEKIEDVKYTMARIYYEHDHLEKAAAAFKDIAYTHSKHRLAVIAANLHLDSLNLLQRYEEMETEAKAYRDKKPITDPEFLKDVNTLYEQISFKKCSIYDDKKEWRRAANCYVAFFRNAPDSEYAIKSLYNAALDFERLRDLGKAIKVRVYLLGQIQKVGEKMKPEERYLIASKTLYNIAGNYHAMAIYRRAANAYEKFAQVFPRDDKAEAALANASTFRHGLGEYDKAIEDYERWLELYGKERPEKAKQIRYEIGRAMDLAASKTAKYSEERLRTYEYFKSFAYRYRKEGASDTTLDAQLRVAKYLLSRKGQYTALGYKELDSLLRNYERLKDTDKKKLTFGRDAAAEALFLKAEQVFEEMAGLKVDSRNPKELKKRLEAKLAVAKKAQDMYKDVIKFGRPDWAIAALYRIGSQMADLAKTIRNSKCPKGLTYDQCEIYQGLLEDKASGAEDAAVSFYEKALEVARTNSWFNDFTKRAETELAQIRPKQYRKPSELRAEPDHVQKGIRSIAFITELKDDDSLGDFGKDEADEPDENTKPAQGADGKPADAKPADGKAADADKDKKPAANTGAR